jgi:hypothetical protein
MGILIFYGLEFGEGKTLCPTTLSYLTWNKLNSIENSLYIHVEIFIFTHINISGIFFAEAIRSIALFGRILSRE